MLQTMLNDDPGLVIAISAILQSKRHWTGAQVDSAFRSDESVAEFLSGLSIRDLEQIRKIVDLHDQAGEYDDDEGKPTTTRETLIGIVAFLQEDAWDREKTEAKSLSSLLENAPAPSGDVTLDAQALMSLGFEIRKGLLDLGSRHTHPAREKVLEWAQTKPTWFTLPWENAKSALESAVLTVNISGTLTGLGAVTAHILAAGLGARLQELAKHA